MKNESRVNKLPSTMVFSVRPACGRESLLHNWLFVSGHKVLVHQCQDQYWSLTRSSSQGRCSSAGGPARHLNNPPEFQSIRMSDERWIQKHFKGRNNSSDFFKIKTPTFSFKYLLLYKLLMFFWTSGQALSTLVRIATWGIPAIGEKVLIWNNSYYNHFIS